MRIAIVAITSQGEKIGHKIVSAFEGAKFFLPQKLNRGVNPKDFIYHELSLKDLTAKLFKEFDGIVFVMALGIVIRVTAPYLKDKYSYPAVVTVDERGEFAISTLSAHEGGANRLAYAVAEAIGAQPVIANASETNKRVIVGIGCKQGVKEEKIIKAIDCALTKGGRSKNEVRCLATIDLKKNEMGLKGASFKLGIPLKFINRSQIERFQGDYQRSPFVKEKVGVEGVCEPCALLAANKAKLILAKVKIGGVTISLAEENYT